MNADHPERRTPLRDQQGGPPPYEEEVVYCYGHPDTPTKLRCSRCDRPICGRCAVPATVGQHCVWCVAEARRSAPKVRSAIAAKAPATLAIVVISVLFYLAQRVYQPLTTELGASPIAIHAGEWWRLLTPMLLHSPGFIFHILFNMLVLWVYGPNVEQSYGTARFVAIYVISGFTAGAASYAFNACTILGVGASGAIFGVVGALLVFLYNRRRSQFVRDYMRQIVGFVAINAVFGFIIPGIDNWAHGGGLVAGALLGWGLDRPAQGGGRSIQLLATAAVIALGVGVVAFRTATFTCGPIG